MQKQNGQALLLIVVSLAAVLTVVLSAVSRSVTDISSTKNEEESLRAFSAAEAGIEKALIAPITGQTTLNSGTNELDNASYSANVVDFAQNQTEFNSPKDLISGDTTTLWFVSHDANGDLSCSGGLPCFFGTQIQVCWGTSNTINNETPALEFTLMYDPNANGNLNDLSISRGAYDPNGGRRGANHYGATSGNCTVAGKTYPFSRTIDLSTDLALPASSYNAANGLQFAYLKLLYNVNNAEPIGVRIIGGNSLPGQGKRIESTGQSGSATRKVEVFTRYPDLPAIFTSAIFSNGGITK